jgi:hypothetical protein
MELLRPSCGWEDSVGMDVEETAYEGMGSIHMAKDRDHWPDLVNKEVRLPVP